MRRIGILMLSAVVLIITCVPAMSQRRGERRGEFWDGARHEVRGSRYSRDHDRRHRTMIATMVALARAGVH